MNEVINVRLKVQTLSEFCDPKYNIVQLIKLVNTGKQKIRSQ